MAQKKHRGDTVGRFFYVKDENGSLTDPTTLTITIKDSDGSTVATKSLADLTKTATGTYKLLYNIPDDAKFGMWTLETKATLTTGNLANTEIFNFVVEEN